jgi:hypothetical protein
MTGDEKVEIVARAICLAGVLPDDIRTDCEVLCSMCFAEAVAAIDAVELCATSEEAPPRAPAQEVRHDIP